MNLGSDIYYLELFEPKIFNSIPPSLLWQVAEIAANHEMVESYDLSLIMSRLQLGAALGGPQVISFRNILINIYLNIFTAVFQFPTYRDVFPSGWTRDTDTEARHEHIMTRIQSWPFDEQVPSHLYVIVTSSLVQRTFVK